MIDKKAKTTTKSNAVLYFEISTIVKKSLVTMEEFVMMELHPMNVIVPVDFLEQTARLVCFIVNHT